MSQANAQKMNVFDSFLAGARDGWTIGIRAMMPAVVMVFALMQILEFTNVLKYIGIIFEPIMGVFGLPGEAATPLVFCIISVVGALAMVADLAMKNVLSPDQVAMLAPSLMLMGAQLNYMGRILGVSAIKTRHYLVIMCMGYINGIIALFVMRLII